jgi:integrase
LGFLDFIGKGDKRLASAVDCPAPGRRGAIPDTLSDEELHSFLKSFNQSTPIGRRDFAMALCLCRLGLRANEVASLRREDVNWHAKTLHLRQTKSRRARVLPLPSDVAQAIAEYLLKGRPDTPVKGLFVWHQAPCCEAQGSSLVRRAMRRAFERCGLGHARVHILRHTVATRMHRHGIGLKAIADLLGHQSLDTTACYTRVNLDELRQAALSWPEEWR